jgi:hypothetical protein
MTSLGNCFLWIFGILFFTCVMFYGELRSTQKMYRELRTQVENHNALQKNEKCRIGGIK